MLTMVYLWAAGRCVGQAWEDNLDGLRKKARRGRMSYVIRDGRGHILESGNYGRGRGKHYGEKESTGEEQSTEQRD